MADELQLVATNAASDGWVDGTPGAVSTGYQAQNTVLQALFNGLDKSSVRIDGANLKIDPSGVIDDSGLPFVVSTLITIALPTTGAANWYLKVVAGSTALERSIEFDDDRGTYDAAKNGFYNTGGERVLNWCYNRHSNTVLRFSDAGSNRADVPLSVDDKNLIMLSDVRFLEWSLSRSNQWLDKMQSGDVGWAAVAYDGYNDAFVGIRHDDGDPNDWDVFKIARDGTLGSTFDSAKTIDMICVDPLTGNLISASSSAGKIYIHVGFSDTITTTISLTVYDLCIDSDGNLITLTNSVVNKHSGLTSTISSTLALNTLVAADVYACCFDHLRGNLVLGWKKNHFIVCDGFSLDIIFASDMVSADNGSIMSLTYDDKYDVLLSVDRAGIIDRSGNIQNHGFKRW